MRKTKFRILDIQISWRHQMPKHKARITFYWITWEVNTVCLSHIAIEKFYQKVQKKGTWKLVPGPFTFAKNEAQAVLKSKHVWSKLLILDIKRICMFAVTQPSLLKSTNSKLFFARICKKKKYKRLIFHTLNFKQA